MTALRKQNGRWPTYVLDLITLWHSQGVTYVEIGKLLGVTDERARDLVRRHEWRKAKAARKGQPSPIQK